VLVLWLLTRDPGPTGGALIAEHAREHEVRTIDLRDAADLPGVLDAVAAADRVVSW
jgi:hypothetical protein